MAEEMLADVEYRDIPGNPGYTVGSDGSVWSWWLKGSQAKTRLATPWRMKGSISEGYLVVCFGKRARKFVHRLVLEVFVGPCPEGMEACHNNGIRTDARLDNLRWDTRKNNHADKWKHGTQQAGQQNPVALLSDVQVTEIKERIVRGELSKDIAAVLGVNKATVSKIRTGKQWSTVSPELNSQFAVSYPHKPGCVSERAKRNGINPQTVFERIKRGWSVEKALNTPARIAKCG